MIVLGFLFKQLSITQTSEKVDQRNIRAKVRWEILAWYCQGKTSKDKITSDIDKHCHPNIRYQATSANHFLQLPGWISTLILNVIKYKHGVIS